MPVAVEIADKRILFRTDGRQRRYRSVALQFAHIYIFRQLKIALQSAVVGTTRRVEIAEILQPCQIIKMRGRRNHISFFFAAAVAAAEIRSLCRTEIVAEIQQFPARKPAERYRNKRERQR